MSVASVVIPAYNEGRVIGRCLQALQSSGLPLEIVVAANGCSDNTVAVAREFEGVRVLDITTASKSNALVTGDDAATVFPRIYLDADIVLGPGALPALIEELSGPGARVAAPHVRFDTSGASWPVRAYYRLYEQTPYVQQGLIGLGVYGISEQGRDRFDTFPDLMADDLFMQRIFAESERITTAGSFTVSTPRTLADLIKVRTRIAKGNTELAGQADSLPPGDYSASTGSTLGAIATMVVRRPQLLPSAVIYVGVVVAARLRAWTSKSAWHRDESTR